MIGTTLAHYQITGHLGTGGMGEVYEATDSRLGRSVAIKFLPEAFARDAGRVTRFEREARVLASLNHPNIAAIHGLEEAGGRHFLVMELVPGETLAERIRRGPVPEDEALGIARQIAAALDSAHEKIVVHRDLKPANIKITPDGVVKVLDFGLAKAYEPEPLSGINLSNSPTLSAAATQQGVILGTAAYMSPEQARGKSADKRADIWAFGIVLYEMLTARQLFAGETVSDTLAAVLEREVRLEHAPPRFRTLLRACLERDPRKRLRDIGDAWRLLDPALAGAEQVATLPARSRRLVLLTAGLGLALAAALVPTSLYFLRVPDETPEIRFEMQAPGTSWPVISPDGQRIAYTATQDGKNMIWIRPIGSVTARPLAGTDASDALFWAPDNRNLGFFADGKLKRIDVTSGVVQTLTEAFGITAAGAWNNAGDVLFSGFSAGGAAIMRVSSSGGTPKPVTPLTDLAKEGVPIFPQFLPDGRHFLYHTLLNSTSTAGVWIGSLDSSESRPSAPLAEIPNMVPGGNSPVLYAEPGYLLFTRDRALLAQPFDAKRRALSGDPMAVAENVGLFSVSQKGTLVYRPATEVSSTGNTTRLLWLDRRGKAAGEIPTPDVVGSLELWRDGERIVIDSNQNRLAAIWVINRGGVPQKLTTDPGFSGYPIWNPMGSLIIFAASRTGGGGLATLYQKASNGVGVEEPLFSSKVADIPRDHSSDGRYIVFDRFASGPQQSDLWILPTFDDKKPVAFLESPARETQAQISPDGRYLAYVTNESGRDQIVVRTFPDANKGQWPITREGGIEPRWRRKDGGELYYLSPDGKVMVVTISSSATAFVPGNAAELFPAPPLFPEPTPFRRRYDVTADGQRFLFAATAGSTSGPPVSTPITAIINWTRALKNK
jgi:Tol biopolymer transport system component